MKFKFFLLLLCSIYVFVTGCQKAPLEEPGTGMSESGNMILYNLKETNEKSYQSTSVFTQHYEIDLNVVSGDLSISIDQSGKLIESKMSLKLYKYLLNKYDAGKLAKLPLSIIEQSSVVVKQENEYFGSGKYIITMSKDDFDKEMEKCENKPTFAGVMLCSARIIIKAITDCLQAPPSTAPIHCW